MQDFSLTFFESIMIVCDQKCQQLVFSLIIMIYYQVFILLYLEGR